MKSAIKNLSIPILALTLSITSCKKYEEGPMISLRSKKERMANTWKVVKATDDGKDITSSYDQYDLQMLTDGDASIAAIYTIGDISFEFETNGTWDFNDNKEELELDMENDKADLAYNILKLKEDELWLREKGTAVELHLEPK